MTKKLISANFEYGNKYKITLKGNKNVLDPYNKITEYSVIYSEYEAILFSKIFNNEVDAVLYYENIRILRNEKNNTNRLNNCEQANVDKMIETASNQIADIKMLEDEGLFDILDEKLQVACMYRKKYPDISLKELSEIITLETGNKITKSGLYHRLNKIHDLATKIK